MYKFWKIIFLTGCLLLFSAPRLYAGSWEVDTDANWLYAAGMIGDSYNVASLAAKNLLIDGRGSVYISGGTNYIRNAGVIRASGDFSHDGSVVGLPNNGDFVFVEKNSELGASGLEIGGNFANGDGAGGGWNLAMNVKTIDVAGKFSAMSGGQITLNPGLGGTLRAGQIEIDSLYIGDSASDAALKISSAMSGGEYSITADTDIDIGSVNAEGGRLNITAGGDIKISGNVSGGLGFQAGGNMWVGGNLGGNGSEIDFDVGELNIAGNINGGTVFRPNKPADVNQSVYADGNFHVNHDTGLAANYKQIVVNPGAGYIGGADKMIINLDGVFRFDDLSYMQLVLNRDNISGANYDANSDGALLTLNGLDASGVSNGLAFSDIDMLPNIEIIVDNVGGNADIALVKIITVKAGTVFDIGGLDFAGIWVYRDTDGDGINDWRIYQEARLYSALDEITNDMNVFAKALTMRSVHGMVAQSASASANDLTMAAAIDELVLLRLRNWTGYNGDNMDGYYSSVMRQLFGADDVYYDLMIAGGWKYDSALGAMISENPDAAVGFVRAIGIGDAADISKNLGMSAIISASASADQMFDDFIWTRHYDKRVAWARAGFGADITSLNFGFDEKFGDWVIGATGGYNALGFSNMSGYDLNLGAYGSYNWNDAARLYGKINFIMHNSDVAISSNAAIGQTNSNITSFDTILDFGAMHRILGTDLTGRGFLITGIRGGYTFSQQYKGADFMDVRVANRLLMMPGYELALGRDLWVSDKTVVRPVLKAGVGYDLMGGAASDLEFKFSGGGTWRKWNTPDSNSSLWMRYGAHVDVSDISGMNFSLGYEVMKSGNMSVSLFKINGVYRFAVGAAPAVSGECAGRPRWDRYIDDNSGLRGAGCFGTAPYYDRDMYGKPKIYGEFENIPEYWYKPVKR